MAKIYTSILDGRFRVESLTVFKRAGSLVVRGRRNSRSSRTCSLAQMEHRACFRNQVNLWRSFPHDGRPLFENKRNGQTDYNIYLSLNMHTEPIYLTRREAENRACVLTPVAVSVGSLPPVYLSHDGVAPVTNLSVGLLTMDANTTVSALSTALVRHNRGLHFCDVLLFFQGLQQWDARLQIPVVEMRCTQLVLSSVDYRTVLAATAGSVGFAVRGGRLAAAAEVQGGMAWVHVRRRDGLVRLSSQYMMCNNPYIAQYSSREAMEAACRSYGVNTRRSFLEPDGGVERCGMMRTNCVTN